MIECKICNKEFKNTNCLVNHIKKDHNLDWQNYLKTIVWEPIDFFGFKIIPGICPICGKPIKLNIRILKKFCSSKCSVAFFKSDLYKKESSKIVKNKIMTKYGSIDNYILQIKKTKFEKHGNENYVNIEKVKETKLKKYGSPTFNNIEKIRKTKFEKYGDSKYNNLEKYKKTCKDLYGVENPNQCDLIKEKIRNTNLEKYGVDNASKSPEIIEKIIKTNNERYGANSALQTPNGKATLKQILASEAVKKKVYETHKRNNSFHTSAPEIKLLKILCDKFGKSEIEYQYRSPKYPYNCDFYIKSLDLYIELQGSWTHGKAPYNLDSKEHQQKLLEWQEKAQTSQFYRNAIDVWTRADVEKRRIAKENGIKLIEVFDSEFFSEISHLIN